MLQLVIRNARSAVCDLETVPAVVHCGWRLGDAAAVVLVNVDRVEHRIEVPVAARNLRLDTRRAYELVRIEGAERAPVGPLPDTPLPVTLPPRKVVVLEAQGS